MKPSLPLAILLSVGARAQDPPVSPTLILVGDGDPAEYSAASVVHPQWQDPDTLVAWSTAPAGFGPLDRAAEVSTVDSFPRLRLRQRFDVSATPETLTLSLKQDEEMLDVYLNGVPVIARTADQLPPPDAGGFRHYDLSSHLALLRPVGNLLAIHTEGTLLVPILHGTTPNVLTSAIAVDPTRVRREEAGPTLPIRVFRYSPTSTKTRLNFVSDGATAKDFRLRLNGIALPLVTNDSGTYFEVPFSGTETEALVEFEATDDIHAEAQEMVELRSPSSVLRGIRLLIGRNDTVVTRTAATGEGSLRQAIENAELIPGVETIRFSDEEGVPFTSAPATVHLESGSPGPYGIRQGFAIEGPPPPGRVSIQSGGGPMFYISGAFGGTPGQDLTLRRLVIRGSSLAVESLRYGGTLLIEDCEFVDNGQALELYNRNTPAVIRRCLFERNGDYAIRQRSGLPIVVENCTFLNHEGPTWTSGAMNFDHCSFVSMLPATSFCRFASGSMRFRNCIFEGDTCDLKNGNSDFDQGGNLFAGTYRAGQPLVPRHPGSLAVPAEAALLRTIDFHGGFTRTIPILADSPALDLGLPPDLASSPFDQRGEGFPRQVGPAPDAGAYELQFDPADLVIGLQTEPDFDPLAGVYFQFAVIHNRTPWTLSGVRLQVTGLPVDAILYNGSGDGFVDVAGPIAPGAYRIVILQYTASRPDLRLTPYLSAGLLPGFDAPGSTPPAMPPAHLVRNADGIPCLHFRSVPGSDYQIEISGDLRHWMASGPVLFAESDHILWKDPDPSPPGARFYRVNPIE